MEKISIIWPKAWDILQKSGGSNFVPTFIASPKDAFDLSFLIEFVRKFPEFSNQRYQHFCQQYPQSSAVNRSQGYQPFTIDDILAFIGLQFILGATRWGLSLFPMYLHLLQKKWSNLKIINWIIPNFPL